MQDRNQLLADYLAGCLATPFEWGKHDCILFAARWVEIATGVDHLEHIESWSTAREALRVRAQHGGTAAIMDARFARVHPNMAPDGSIALFEKSLCIVAGVYLVGAGLQGLETINRTKAQCAWLI